MWLRENLKKIETVFLLFLFFLFKKQTNSFFDLVLDVYFSFF